MLHAHRHTDKYIHSAWGTVQTITGQGTYWRSGELAYDAEKQMEIKEAPML